MTADSDAPLTEADGREVLRASEGLLLRALHPQMVKNGEVNVRAFRPIPVDEGEFSVDRASFSTPEESYQRRIRRGRRSVGVWGLSIAAVVDAGSRALADPISEDEADGTEANPAHAIVDFRGLTGDAEEDLATALWEDATQRGCLYQPPAAT